MAHKTLKGPFKPDVLQDAPAVEVQKHWRTPYFLAGALSWGDVAAQNGGEGSKPSTLDVQAKLGFPL